MILVRQEVKYSKLKSVVLKVKIISVVLLLFCPFKVIKIMKAPLVFCNFFWGGGVVVENADCFEVIMVIRVMLRKVWKYYKVAHLGDRTKGNLKKTPTREKIWHEPSVYGLQHLISWICFLFTIAISNLFHA